MVKQFALSAWFLLWAVACGSSQSGTHDGPQNPDQRQADLQQADLQRADLQQVDQTLVDGPPPDSRIEGFAEDAASADAGVDSHPRSDVTGDQRPKDVGTPDAASRDSGAPIDSGAPDLAADTLSGLWEIERNNTFASAHDLSPHGFPVEVNATDDTLDYFRISAAAGSLLRISLTPDPQSTTRYTFRVAHVSGRSPYEHGAQAPAAGQPVGRQLFLVEGGDYFVQVSGNGSNEHYLLRIEQLPLPTPTDVSALTSTTAAFTEGNVTFFGIQPSAASHAAVMATSASFFPRLLVWDPVAQRVVMSATDFAHLGTRVVWEHLASHAFWIVADAELFAGAGDIALAIQQTTRITPGVSPTVSAPLSVGRTVTSIRTLDFGRTAYYRAWLERGSYTIAVNGTLDPVNLMRPQIDIYRADHQTWLRQAARVGYAASTILRVEEPQAVSIRLWDNQPTFPGLKSSYTLSLMPSTFSPAVPTAASSSPLVGQLTNSKESMIYAIDHPGGLLALSVDGEGTFIPALHIWEDNLYVPGAPYNTPYSAVTNRYAMSLPGPRRYYVEVNARYSRSSGSFTLRWERYDIPAFGASYLHESETPPTLGANDTCSTAEPLSVIPGAIEANLEEASKPDADAFTFTATATNHRLRTYDIYAVPQDVQLALYDPSAPSTPLATSTDVNLAKEVWQTEINATGLTIGKSYCVIVSRDPSPEILANTSYILLVTE